MGKYIQYLRKSQMDRDYESLSVEETLSRHRMILADFVKAQKLNVAVNLEEVVSAESLSARPQMMKLLELVNTGDYEGIVCMDIDRLSRGSSFDSGYIMQLLQLNNCKIVTPQKTYDLSNETDEQFADLKFMFSRYELQTITKRMTNGRNTSVSEGKFVGSKAPLGYRTVKLKGEKGNMLEIDPETAPTVRMIFDWYTNEGLGSGKIAQRLNDLQIKPMYSERWTAAVIIQILSNETYTGKIRWKRKPLQKKFIDGTMVKSRISNKEYQIFEGKHEAIISEEQFEEAQRLREERRVAPKRAEVHLINPFAGLLFCGCCGGRMEMVSFSKDSHAKPRYRCKGPLRCGCKSHIAEDVEVLAVAELEAWLNRCAQKSEPREAELEIVKNRLEMRRRELDDFIDQQDAICNLYEKGKYSEQLFNRRMGWLEQEIRRIRKEMEREEAEVLKWKDHRRMVQEVFATARTLLEFYDRFTPEEKNRLWKKVIQKITYFKDETKGNIQVVIHPKA